MVAHPQLIRRGDRRALLAAGAAAVLLIAPAADATALGGLTLDCSPEAVAGNAGLREQCAEAGLLSGLGTVLPEPVQSIVDPIERVVDDVLKKAPAGVGDVLGETPGLVEGVVESLPVAPPPIDPVLPDPVPQPPAGELGPPDAPVATVTPTGPPQGPGIANPPFIRRGVASRATTSRPVVHPFVAPVVSGPFMGDLAAVAEEFLSGPVTSGLDAITGMGGSPTTTAPGPDAPSWLLATAGGMLLLLGASHLVHARHRYAASVAR